MARPDAPCILVVGDDDGLVRELRCPLELAGYSVVQTGGHASDCQLVIAAGGDARQTALQRADEKGSAVPLLAVLAAPSPAARTAALTAGADAVLAAPVAEGELLAQVGALLRVTQRHGRLAARAAELEAVNDRLRRTHERVAQELELARRIQLSFLPQDLPEAPGVRFAVHYRPCGRVGGDFYDVFRLDEHHVGFYVADAMGHGVPAALLTMFLKRGVRPKDIYQSQYRLVPPGEVLQRLNHDLIVQAVTENSFITMVYGLYNTAEKTLRFARAGHPHPLYLPAGGPTQRWELPGSLLGVLTAPYADRLCRLGPGDKVLFHTDGADGIGNPVGGAGPEGLFACAERHRRLPVARLVEQLAHDLVCQPDEPDDLTLLGLEVVE
jgi:sigma-B regulation protein RsbU (phosphoserine phosphatase)